LKGARDGTRRRIASGGARIIAGVLDVSGAQREGD